MCAINGIAGKIGAAGESLVNKMNVATVHRGPDATAAFWENGIALGFNRLAIIDLSERGMQPMKDVTGRYTIVFNGEIYNYKDLKAELLEYPFQSESDTEVILAAYSRWGMAAFSKLNGMFALALWDSKEEQLVLARDSVGVKPLYFYTDGARLVFSSEIKAILEAGIPRVLDREAFGHYMRLLYVPAPMTMFQGVSKLLPGHTLVFSGGNATVEPFKGMWPHTAGPTSYEGAVRSVRKTVEGAVARQLVSDRPVGVYLSGGIDSSVVLASASKVHPKIDTFSVGFDLGEGEESEKFNADALLAKKTAGHFGSTHHEFFLSSDNALDLFSKTIRHLDEPIANATAIAQLYLAQQVKPTATVVLTGDGGDELFGGYERYRMSFLAEKYGSLVPKFISEAFPRLNNINIEGVDRFAQLMFQKDTELGRIISKNVVLPDTRALFESEFEVSGSIVEKLMRTDERNWLVDEALMRADKAGMAGSIEVRVPLLDLEVRSLAHVLPLSYKVTPLSTKRILKDAFKNVLPAEILNQPKRGWFSPGAKWLRHPDFVKFADEVFSPTYAPGVSSLFNFPSIRHMWTEHREKKGYHYTSLFSVLSFLEWAKEYKVSL